MLHFDPRTNPLKRRKYFPEVVQIGGPETHIGVCGAILIALTLGVVANDFILFLV